MDEGVWILDSINSLSLASYSRITISFSKMASIRIFFSSPIFSFDSLSDWDSFCRSLICPSFSWRMDSTLCTSDSNFLNCCVVSSISLRLTASSSSLYHRTLTLSYCPLCFQRPCSMRDFHSGWSARVEDWWTRWRGISSGSGSIGEIGLGQRCSWIFYVHSASSIT